MKNKDIGSDHWWNLKVKYVNGPLLLLEIEMATCRSTKEKVDILQTAIQKWPAPFETTKWPFPASVEKLKEIKKDDCKRFFEKLEKMSLKESTLFIEEVVERRNYLAAESIWKEIEDGFDGYKSSKDKLALLYGQEKSIKQGSFEKILSKDSHYELNLLSKIQAEIQYHEKICTFPKNQSASGITTSAHDIKPEALAKLNQAKALQVLPNDLKLRWLKGEGQLLLLLQQFAEVSLIQPPIDNDYLRILNVHFVDKEKKPFPLRSTFNTLFQPKNPDIATKHNTSKSTNLPYENLIPWNGSTRQLIYFCYRLGEEGLITHFIEGNNTQCWEIMKAHFLDQNGNVLSTSGLSSSWDAMRQNEVHPKKPKESDANEIDRILEKIHPPPE
jgi:hypothetical protein